MNALIISSGKQKFSIILDVDRINQNIDASIIQDDNYDTNAVEEGNLKTIQQKYTEIEIHIPIINIGDTGFVRRLQSSNLIKQNSIQTG